MLRWGDESMEIPKFSDKLKTTYLPKNTAEGKQKTFATHLQGTGVTS
jgi:hypothetical protein